MTDAEQIRHLRISAKTLRHRARVQSPVEISPEMALDRAITCEALAEYRQERVESAARAGVVVERRA